MAVVRQGRVLLSEGIGFADAVTSTRNSPGTRFRIGSLTKAFTAAAVLRLVQAGRLSVSSRVCGYVSSCPSAWQAVTLQELLDHTSGIPDYTTTSGYRRLSVRQVSPQSLLALVRSRPLEFAPGSRWRYSNTNYVLLGMVIERVSGMSYAAYIQRRLLGPAGLRATGYDSDRPPLATHAVGYADPGVEAPFIDMSVPYAAGALFSTVGDLARWDAILLGGAPHLLSRASLAAMFQPHARIDAADPTAGAYGDGWFIDEGGAEYDHDGLINGFASYNAMFPSSGLVVVVLSNLQSSDVRTIAERLAGLLGARAH